MREVLRMFPLHLFQPVSGNDSLSASSAVTSGDEIVKREQTHPGGGRGVFSQLFCPGKEGRVFGTGGGFGRTQDLSWEVDTVREKLDVGSDVVVDTVNSGRNVGEAGVQREGEL